MRRVIRDISSVLILSGLLLVLDAHRAHPEPFCAQDLLPYRHAQEPADQTQAIQRRKVMRKARSPKNARSSSPS